MNEIIMNEYQYAKDLLNKEKLSPLDLGKKPSATLNLIARYYRSEQVDEQQLPILLSNFLKSCLPDYNDSKWIDSISYQVRRSKKYGLKIVEEINVTKNEIKSIENIKGKKHQRIAFTMLVLAKFYNCLSEKNNNWVNTSINNIFSLSNTQIKRTEQMYMINDLYSQGLIGISKNVGSPNVQVNYIDDNSDVVLSIHRLRDLGKEYMLYCGENYVRCENCGRLIKNYKNRSKYCSECTKYTPIGTKTVICIDCGKEFTVDASSRQIRCDECKRKKQLQYQRDSMRKIRSVK